MRHVWTQSVFFRLFCLNDSTEEHLFSLYDSASALQSAGGEWSGTHKEEAPPASPPILLSHLIMWNNFSRCPALISLCGNSSLVPNCGARRTQAEHTAERKGNNWSLPCLAHRFLLTFIIIIMSFTEGDCMVSFRHFMSAAPLFEPSHYLAQSLYFLLFFLYCRRFTTWFLSSYTNGMKCVVDAKTKTCQEKRRHQVKILLLIFRLALQRCRVFTRWFQISYQLSAHLNFAFWLFVAPQHRLDASKQGGSQIRSELEESEIIPVQLPIKKNIILNQTKINN